MTETLTPDPFDPASLRLDQSFVDGAAVKKLLMTVPVRKPKRQDLVRVHPDPAYRVTSVGIIELRDVQETYLVSPVMAGDLEREIARATLFLAINRQGVLFLWPVKLPGPDGKHNEWHRSAAEAAEATGGLAEGRTVAHQAPSFHLAAHLTPSSLKASPPLLAGRLYAPDLTDVTDHVKRANR